MPDILQTLQGTFGFADFRPGQREVISRLLDGKSVLGIFPTGSGKSLCFQLPALLLPGLTVVVSPLIALMREQVLFLQSRNIAAERLDSSLTLDETREVMRKLRAGQLRMLYLSPERFVSERFRSDLLGRQIDLLAVDESHCVSEWGHAFRPDYLRLGQVADRLKISRILALTATAPPLVARSIAQEFGIAAEDIICTGFHRPNLKFSVLPTSPEDRMEKLDEVLKVPPAGAAIVYVTLQKTADEVAEDLRKRGWSAKAYHAGMETEERSAVQNWFMSDPNAIVVATIAFGMGIDKADIRRVVHFNLPKSLEGYAQEVGRAGRDGHDSACDMLACLEDRISIENFIFGDTPTKTAFGELCKDILSRTGSFDLSVYELANAFDIRALVIETFLTYLELEGIIESSGEFYTQVSFKTAYRPEEIANRFQGERRSFIQSIFQQAKSGKTWWSLDPTVVAGTLNQPRERITTALQYLQEQGLLEVKPSGVRAGYRRLPVDVDVAELQQKLFERFLQREQRDLQRFGLVLKFAAHSGCRTEALGSYFGEKIPGGRCGHCSTCLGEPVLPLREPPSIKPGPVEKQLATEILNQRFPELATPRTLTRFLCGVTSPHTVRAKLHRHKQFGCLGHIPFFEVLKLLEEIRRERA